MTNYDQSIKGLVLKFAPIALVVLFITSGVVIDWDRSMEVSAQQAYNLVKGAPDLRAGSPVITSTGGPDSYGYRWMDSDEAGGPAFEWNDISGLGFPILLLDDNDVSLSLPFNFYFYGVSQSVVRVSSNGFLTFDGSGSQWQNDSIPSVAAPDDIIAAFWDDLNPALGGAVYYYHDTGENEFIVQYDGISPAFGPGLYTFQVILRPNSSISFRYLSMQGTTNSATVGIENSDASTGLEIAFNTAYIKDSLAVDIWPLFEVPSLYSTIQEAIDETGGSGDTVLVDSGTYTGAGNKELNFGGKNILLTSVGGASTTIIDCEGNGTGIIFNNGEDSTAVIDGFTISRGDSGQGGGMVFLSESSPTIRNCIISDNEAGVNGGGIYIASSSDPTFINCSITANTTMTGGGVYCRDGSADFLNCTLAGNTATLVGGAAFATNSNLTFTSCIITGNYAADGGAGIRLFSAPALITASTISGNRSDGISAIGGGIKAYDSSITIDRTIMTGNCATADQGEEIFLEDGGSVAIFNCCNLDSAKIDGTGAIIYFLDNIFTNPLFCGPSDCINAPTTAGNYSLAANSPCLAEYAPCGQQIGLLGEDCSAQELIVPTNFATIQLAIDAANPGDTVTVLDGTYTGAGNKDLDFGGKNMVLITQNGPGSTIIDCQGSGRGIIFENGEDSTSVVTGFTIENGAADWGGGIYIEFDEYPKIQNCIIQNCFADFGGGGIYCLGKGLFENCWVFDDSSTTAGGIYCDNAELTNCYIAGNRASGNGGGVRTRGGSFNDCTIVGNSASGGGGVYTGAESGAASFIRCTISGNTATSGGGMQLSSDADMTNCILWGNCSDEAEISGSATLSFYCSDVDSSAIAGFGTVNYDVNTICTAPLFCDPLSCASAPSTSGEFTLAANSSCLAANSPCGNLMGAQGQNCSARPNADYETIQAAIDAAITGDTVLVMDGTYTGLGNKDLNFGGKNLVLMSENGADFTIIDCEGSGRGIYFNNGEDSSAVVDGFTITNGVASQGGGIFAWGPSETPTIRNCVVKNCDGSGGLGYGGGICCGGAMTLENCVIIGNTGSRGGGIFFLGGGEASNCLVAGNIASGLGGGIYSWDATFEGCTITGNISAEGGGIKVGSSGSPVSSSSSFTNCTISGNSAPTGGGISAHRDAVLANCILWGNCADEAKVHAGVTLDFYCCDVQSGLVSGPGVANYDGFSIFTDPLFCEAAPCDAAPTTVGEYTLHGNSPCLADSSLCSLLIGALAEACSSRVFEVGDSTVYPTIQSAIDATSQPGDTVLVSDSTWTGTGNTVLDFGGRNIVLISKNGPSVTIIDCEGSARGILFENGEDSTAVVEGFTITNGDSTEPGSAILVRNSSPTIINCIAAENRADSGVVRIDGGSPRFTSLTMQYDSTTTSNGLLMVTGGAPRFDSCVVQNNFANQCISLDAGSPVFTDCVVQNNTANHAVLVSTPAAFTRTSIVGNGGNGIYFTTAPPSLVDSCAISGNMEWGAVLDGTSSIFNNCEFLQNQGGGLLITGAVPPSAYTMNSTAAPMDTCNCSEFNTCTFAGNVNTTSRGGGCRIDGGTPELPYTPFFRFCSFTGNTSILDGGGIAVVGTAVSADISPRFENCTITANTCGGDGGGIYMGVKAQGAGASAIFDRTILWGNCTIESNSGQAYVDSGNSVIFNCSNVANYGFEGKGTIDYGDSVTYGLPFFCETVVCDPQGTIEGNFALAANSAASPDSNPCHVLIGAHPVAVCNPTHVPEVPELPVQTVLRHCTPNPFNPMTMIQFDLATQSQVSLRIYDVSGRLVKTLIDKIMPQATHQIRWHGDDNHGNRVATGVYFLRLSAGDVVQTRKMVLIK